MSRPLTISSSANPLVKEVRRAVDRGALTADGCCVAETVHLLEEALRSGEVQQVLAAESALSTVESRLQGRSNIPLAILPDKLFRTISSTETSQGVIALVKPREWTLDHLFGPSDAVGTLLVVLDGVQDPGNAGAIVRAAEAFAATGVVFVRGSVSPYNPKTLRGSAGSSFRVPMVHGVLATDVVSACEKHSVERIATLPAGKWGPPDFTRACALIIGGENRGVSDELKAGALPISISTRGVESLNASVAASILLYESARQRGGRR